MLKNFYREHAIQLSLIGLIIGLVFLFLSIIGIFLGEQDFVKNNEFLQDIFKGLGNYIYWLFIGMIVLTIASGWIFGDLIISLNKFKKLIDTTSKATFVRNQNEIEELGWKLGPKYHVIVNERKRKFRIRD